MLGGSENVSRERGRADGGLALVAPVAAELGCCQPLPPPLRCHPAAVASTPAAAGHQAGVCAGGGQLVWPSGGSHHRCPPTFPPGQLAGVCPWPEQSSAARGSRESAIVGLLKLLALLSIAIPAVPAVPAVPVTPILPAAAVRKALAAGMFINAAKLTDEMQVKLSGG